VDLKGAPPLASSSFWERWCRYVKDKGRVQGLVLEFEDVLPIQILEEVDTNKTRRHVYTTEQVQRLVAVASGQGLQIIPLVQTFGHLEYLLKYRKYAHLREVRDYPDSIQAAENSRSESLQVICQLIDQVMTLLTELKTGAAVPAIHLGGDEVWHMGQGERSKERILSENESRIGLFMKHMSLVVGHVSAKYPDKRVLIWDDMLRAEKVCAMKSHPADYKVLSEHAEVVVWQYAAEPGRFLPPDLFAKISSVFAKPPWIATAFKGASSSCALIPDLGLHVANHLGWSKAIQSSQPFGKVEPSGIILTGWQRFDHYAALCELLPVSVPSLRCCFMVLDKGKFADEELQACFQELGLQNPHVEGNEPKFPGSELYVSMTKLVGLRTTYQDFMRHDTLTTWVNDWQVSNRCVSRLQSEAIVRSLRKMQADMNVIKPGLVASLDLHFDAKTRDEWFGTYFDPIEINLQGMIDKITKAVETL